MTDSKDYNPSLNTLLASFTHISPNSVDQIKDADAVESICIDTSSNRIGINTFDPSYSLHIMDTNDYSGNIYVSEVICVTGNMHIIDVSSIVFKDTISGPILDVSRLDVSSIIFKDTISGPILNVNNLININTISGTNLFFDVSKIDISGTIDLSFSFRPKFFIPSSRNDVSVNEIYYDLSNSDGILMIKLTS